MSRLPSTSRLGPIACILCLTMGSSGVVIAEESHTQSSRRVELIRDASFALGSHVFGPKLEHGKRKPIGTLRAKPSKGTPVWDLVQWHSRFNLAAARPERLPSGGVRFADRAKALTLGTSDADAVFSFDTRPEYPDRARRRGENWPHLLVEQSFDKKPALNQLEQLRFRIEFRLRRSATHKTPDYDPSLHAAQFLAYLTVQNRNPQSPGYRDYLWFGIPMYDDRDFPTTQHAALDPGTGKFIYSPSSKIYFRQDPRDGKWITIDKDVLPLIHKALATAWRKDFLTKSRDPADLRVGYLNLGWEMPGTFNAAVQIEDLTIMAVPTDGDDSELSL